MKKRGINWKLLALSFLIVYSLGIIGSLFMGDATNSSWYSSIKPSITPPSFVFPIVWNILFFMIAVSFYLILKAHTKNKTFILGLFLSNFVLNAIWTLFYFRMQNPLLAFIDILLLICSTTLLVFYNYKINKTASYLLIPYLLWLGFAGILNFLSI